MPLWQLPLLGSLLWIRDLWDAFACIQLSGTNRFGNPFKDLAAIFLSFPL
jgi:hypothetical protein